MKNIIKAVALVIYLIISINAGAQYRWEWGKSLHSTTGGVITTSEGWAIATDHFGHVYAGTMVLGSGIVTTAVFDTFHYTPPSGYGWYSPLIKFDTSGKVIWAKFYYCLSMGISSLVTDWVGNVYIAGSFQTDSLVFGPYVLRRSTGISGRSSDFIAKLDSNGSFIWAKKIDSCGYFPSLTTDKSGHLYFTGSFLTRQLILGTDTLVNHHPGYDEILVMKMDTSGSVIWARNAGGDSALYSDMGTNAIAVDSVGNVVITGSMSSTLHFDTVTLTTTFPIHIPRVFVAKYSPMGALLWAKSPGGISHFTGSGASGYWYRGDLGNGVALDNLSNVYVMASMSTYCMYFGADTVFNYNEGVSNDAVLAKLNANGDPIWMKKFGGTGDDWGFAVLLDSSYQNVWISGGLQSSVGHFGTDTVYQTDSPSFLQSSRDGSFIAKLDTSGRSVWITTLTYGGDDMNGIAVDAVGNLYFSGDYFSVHPYDTFVVGCDTLAYTYDENFFIAKLAGPWVRHLDTTHTDTTRGHLQIAPETNKADVGIYPNPTSGKVTIEHGANCDITISDITGRIALQFHLLSDKEIFDVGKLKNGIYFIETYDGATEKRSIKKLLKE